MKLIVILDYDMTIVDSLAVFYRVFNLLLEKYFGERVSYMEFNKMFCENTIDGYKNYPKEFWSEFKQLYKANSPEEVKPMPGLKEFLDELKKAKIETYIITGRGIDPEEVEKELRAIGLDDFKGKIRTLKDLSGDHPFDKTQEVKRLLSEQGETKCILFGDYTDDIIAAKRNNCIAVGITNGCKSEEYFKNIGADYVIKDLTEGSYILREILAGQ
ncbi:MAG: hypothetical protein C0177_02180 [Fervidicoccus fontis]|nr:MAG: hypothetical protein C0177_02180 [Fervidicoccus fontis]